MPANVLVVFGSRTIEPHFDLLDALSYTHNVGFDTIISGGARGVDWIAELWAVSKGKDFIPFPADWNMYGKSAGMRRNARMAAYATHGIAVWDGASRGTEAMLNMMRQRQKPVAVYIA